RFAPPFETALQPVPSGVSSIYGPAAPFGSPAFALRDALDITARSVSEPAEPIAGWRGAGSLWPSQRFSLRVPQHWNGRLVVAGCPGQRTEFACDRMFADPLLARGYAYVSGNKGNGDGAAIVEPNVELAIEGAVLPRFPLRDGRALVFWQHAPGHRFERWLDEMIELVGLASDVLERTFRRRTEATYAIGLSNGGYQVRRTVEACDLFDGALTWNAVLWTVQENLLISLPQAIAAMEAGQPERLAEDGFPPDVPAASGRGSLYQKNLLAYWYVTLWLQAMHLDPQASIAYGDVTDPSIAQSWCARISQWRFDPTPQMTQRIERFANTGALQCRLIDLSSQYDHLIPPRLHLEPYARMVAAAGKADLYRCRVIADAQHVDAWSEDPDYPQLRPGYPDVMQAWDELVAWVEGEAVKTR
ncbi:MAG TPA: hypothetical protein VNG31_07375, partial [Candidatus Baltobacteraceae bacterium]|nr:hypothetical protein [Candidatus Baltobacteraceae bacterium]